MALPQDQQLQVARLITLAQQLATERYALAEQNLDTGRAASTATISAERRTTTEQLVRWCRQDVTRFAEVREAVELGIRRALLDVVADGFAALAWKEHLELTVMVGIAEWARVKVGRYAAPMRNPLEARERWFNRYGTRQYTRLLLKAERQYERQDVKRTISTRKAYTSLMALVDAFGRERAFAPPAVVMLMRDIHLRMNADVNEAQRCLADEKVFGPMLRPHATGQRTPSRPRHRDPAATRTLSWYSPTSSPVDGILNGLVAWRKKRNAVLRPILSRALPTDSYPWRSLGAVMTAPLLADLPTQDADALNDATTGSADGERHLEDIFRRINTARVEGFIAFGVTLRNERTMRCPEGRWISLVAWASRNTDSRDFLGVGTSDAYISVETYNRHGPMSYDIGVSGVEVQVQFPPFLKVDTELVGSEPSAPRGWYEHTDYRLLSLDRSSQRQELADKILWGYFGRSFAGQFETQLENLSHSFSPPQLSGAEVTEIQALAPDAYRRAVRLLPGGSGRVSGRINVAAINSLLHPPIRRPGAATLLSGLFWSAVSARSPAEAARAESHRTRLRHAMGAALLRSSLGPHDPVGRALVTWLFVTATPGPLSENQPWLESALPSTGTRLSPIASILNADPTNAASWATPGASGDFTSGRLLTRDSTAVLVSTIQAATDDVMRTDAGFRAAMEQYLDDELPRPAVPAAAGSASASTAEAADPEGATAPVRLDHTQGAMAVVAHRYRRIWPLGADSLASRAEREELRTTMAPQDLWVRVQYMHMHGFAPPASGGVSSGRTYTIPLTLGRSGMTGNANSPHIHMQIDVFPRRPERGVETLGFLSPLEFFVPRPMTTEEQRLLRP